MPVIGGMGGPTWYRGVVSGGNPICSFRRFFAKMCRFTTIQNITDRRHAVPKARPYGRPKMAELVSTHSGSYDAVSRNEVPFGNLDNDQ